MQTNPGDTLMFISSISTILANCQHQQLLYFWKLFILISFIVSMSSLIMWLGPLGMFVVWTGLIINQVMPIDCGHNCSDRRYQYWVLA